MKILFFLLLVTSGGVFASKNDYSLFHPTPENEMRHFRTERPDKTRTAYTIDAGHLQIESELLTLTHSAESEGLEVLRSNFRLGLTNNTELQIQVTPYTAEKENSGRAGRWRDGFGNVTMRFKYNVIGNGSGSFAAALLPFISLPTEGGSSGPDKTAFGFLLPLDYALSETWRTGAMFGVNQNRREEGTSEYTGSASLSHLFFDKVWVYGEIYHSRRDIAEAEQITTADFVVQYEFSEKFNLDVGTFLGLTEASEKQVYFVGGSWLF